MNEELFLIYLLKKKTPSPSLISPRLTSSMYIHGKTDSSEIKKMLQNPPSSWRKMFKSEGISETPSITEVLSLLDETAGSNVSFERDTSSENPKTYKPPKKVRDEAMKGIILSYENNYPSYKGIGLARAIQLATQDYIWEKSVERMQAFFKRNKRSETMGSDTNPTKSYMAWLNWGGRSGMEWVLNL